MSDPHDTTRLFAALSVGIGLVVAGLGNALIGPRRWRGQSAVALAGVAASAVVAWLIGSGLFAPIIGVGVGSLVIATALRTAVAKRFGRAAVAAFALPRVRWTVVGMVGLAGLGYELHRHEAREEADLERQMEEMIALLDHSEGVPVSGVRLFTDKGRAVTPLKSARPRTLAEMHRSENLALERLPVHTQLIHRGEPSDDSNCHGWVFTGGRYAIGGHDVDGILADHGYGEASEPIPGDVCVYRDSRGAVAHTAVVRAVLDDGEGTVLVEGKWGWLGVYLHPVGASCYGQDFHYFHTDRGTHLLAGLQADAPVAFAPGP